MNGKILSWAVASLLIAVSATTGKTAEISAAASQPAAFEAAAAAVSESVLWSFGAISDDGSFPHAGLLADKWGNLYGTTVNGGTNSGCCGTVFEVSPPHGRQAQWSERVLWNFGASSVDGANPEAGLIADKWGNLYGTTLNGGANGLGTVFELSPPAGQQTQWTERVLWSFGASNVDGFGPEAGLLADKWGNLYGTTHVGGANTLLKGGTMFELSPPAGQQTQWTERVLWSFGVTSSETSPNDGQFPDAGLIADKWGNLYGTTSEGGANGSDVGTVFELSPPHGQQTQWNERVLWSFGVISGDGQLPNAALLADQWDNLYSTTSEGGANAKGTVFELSPPAGQQTQWRERVLWSFGSASGDDGAVPVAGLLADKWGNLYSTTLYGGGSSCLDNLGCGTVFELSPPAGQQTQWNEYVLWSFGVISGDGQFPFAGLLADQWGNLYGATGGGGANSCTNTFACGGTVFELSLPRGHSRKP